MAKELTKKQIKACKDNYDYYHQPVEYHANGFKNTMINIVTITILIIAYPALTLFDVITDMFKKNK